MTIISLREKDAEMLYFRQKTWHVCKTDQLPEKIDFAHPLFIWERCGGTGLTGRIEVCEDIKGSLEEIYPKLLNKKGKPLFGYSEKWLRFRFGGCETVRAIKIKRAWIHGRALSLGDLGLTETPHYFREYLPMPDALTSEINKSIDFDVLFAQNNFIDFDYERVRLPTVFA